MSTVRDAVFEELRNLGVTRMFANPGSTEVAFLTDLTPEMEFVLALHEGAVIGMATGEAIATGRPALALLHTTAGYGNAVGAIATARANRAPMVILVGQQDRRHLASEPFLAGRLHGLAGDYPVSVREPARAQDLPAVIARAFHDALIHRGPAVVIVPMGDWDETADETIELAAPAELLISGGADAAVVARLTALLDGAERPALVLGSSTDQPETWAAVAALAARLGCDVWAEAHAARASIDQTSRPWAGHLPAERGALRKALSPYDTVLVIGAPAFRQYLWSPGRFAEPGTTVAVLTDDPDEAAYSAAALAVVGPVRATVTALAETTAARTDSATGAITRPAAPAPLADDQQLTPAHVFSELYARLPEVSTLIEESPSTRRLLMDTVPARRPLGFLTPAQGGLGFALAAATGLKMGAPERPVVAVVGDGASLYNIQTVWSAAHYGVGALYVIMSNGGYAVMDRLAVNAGGEAPWPGFGEISVSTIAAGFGCPSRRVTTYDELVAVLDEVVPTLADRREPLLLDVAVAS
ncbi:thiamine pyrophosphate-dependent enzyme [Nocardioides nematodiphilus]|uniref:thiamine pyrophosphate-dependent enzyme n=1 Tax=Nocardioides nematodiphilus TaxID=2849669 RepID=UPI001CD982EC|nr:thiamine pyrophosphate-dependent enzyme [Nocardioides nematodiphilus]MCA1983250.1 thiamine pyrophosphate-binding protein [Nocardioides nematodiphilus]